MEHLRITVEGKVYDVVVEKIVGEEVDTSSPQAPVIRQRLAANPAAAVAPAALPPAAAGSVTSPLAGIVHSIELEVGAVVAEDDLVITLEAMKMCTAINAPVAGTITAILVKVGDAVAEGQALFTID